MVTFKEKSAWFMVSNCTFLFLFFVRERKRCKKNDLILFYM